MYHFFIANVGTTPANRFVPGQASEQIDPCIRINRLDRFRNKKIVWTRLGAIAAKGASPTGKIHVGYPFGTDKYNLFLA